jgi:hypothetical protein
MKIYGPDALWRPDLISGAAFLYFHDERILFPLHPSVSTFLTGVDPSSFYAYVEELHPAWWPKFKAFLDRWLTYRRSLMATSRMTEPLGLHTVMLSYPRDDSALTRAQSAIASSGLPPQDVTDAIDPFSAADELYSHLFLEKIIELYGEDLNQRLPWAEGETGWDHVPRRRVEWRALYDYCDGLFSADPLEELLTKTYFFRFFVLSTFQDLGLLLSNEGLIPLLASLPTETPQHGLDASSSQVWDMVAWEFFRQLVSPALDPLDHRRASRLADLRQRRSSEIQRLKARCLKLGQELSEKPTDLTSLKSTVRDHIRASVQKEVQAVLELDNSTAEEFVAAVLSDEKAWIGVGSFMLSLGAGGPILTAGSALYALGNVGSKAAAATARRRARLKTDDFALLYRMKPGK